MSGVECQPVGFLFPDNSAFDLAVLAPPPCTGIILAAGLSGSSESGIAPPEYIL
jgi:hypothetical protein